jgi:hypothetical protein
MSDRLAQQLGLIGELAAQNPWIPIMIYGITVLAAVVYHALTGGWLFGSLVLFAGLVFFGMVSGNALQRERIKIERDKAMLYELWTKRSNPSDDPSAPNVVSGDDEVPRNDKPSNSPE